MESRKSGARNGQKIKILYLLQILMDYTDATHDITLQEIIDKLALYGVTAERKSLYDDFTKLAEFGIEVEKTQYNRNAHYKITNRKFELAELKLLVDSVQSAKFITEEKSHELIKKLEHLASKYEASNLQRQVYVSGRVKSMNTDVLTNVDMIHKAIASNVMISYQYYQWNTKKEMELRRNGERYVISPWGLLWEDENYYMVGFDQSADRIKHFRVDKMLNMRMESVKREGRERFQELNMGMYAKKMFGMFDGEEQRVTLLCKNEMAGVMIDRFGKEIPMLKADESHIKVIVNVALSRHFMGWLMSLSDGVRVISPEPVVFAIREEIERMKRQYDT